jgi:hypothetical protein
VSFPILDHSLRNTESFGILKVNNTLLKSYCLTVHETTTTSHLRPNLNQMSSSEQISKYNERIRELQSKLSDEVDKNKKQRINYDIEILKLRVRISTLQTQKKNFS